MVKRGEILRCLRACVRACLPRLALLSPPAASASPSAFPAFISWLRYFLVFAVHACACMLRVSCFCPLVYSPLCGFPPPLVCLVDIVLEFVLPRRPAHARRACVTESLARAGSGSERPLADFRPDGNKRQVSRTLPWEGPAGVLAGSGNRRDAPSAASRGGGREGLAWAWLARRRRAWRPRDTAIVVIRPFSISLPPSSFPFCPLLPFFPSFLSFCSSLPPLLPGEDSALWLRLRPEGFPLRRDALTPRGARPRRGAAEELRRMHVARAAATSPAPPPSPWRSCRRACLPRLAVPGRCTLPRALALPWPRNGGGSGRTPFAPRQRPLFAAPAGGFV